MNKYSNATETIKERVTFREAAESAKDEREKLLARLSELNGKTICADGGGQ